MDLAPPAIALAAPATGNPAASDAASRDRAGLAKAAQGFEAVFLRQMLAAAAATDFGGDDLFGSSGMTTFRELRDARFAEIAAGAGTIGLATRIEAQLARHIGGESGQAKD